MLQLGAFAQEQWVKVPISKTYVLAYQVGGFPTVFTGQLIE